jgi:hypothetical protein
MNNPLTLVPSEGTSDEFPVLKAFQEYIDAEQTKARKRMLGLSVFFIVLLFVVIVSFVLILTTVLNRNQSLSDRLLDYALREKAPIVQQQVPTSVIPQTSADIVKKLIERLEKEQSEMKLALEKQRKDAEDRAAAAKQAHAEDLARVKAQFEKERAKVQKEADKKAQIERHRRRLYPDYYGTDGNDDLPIPPPASTFRRSASLQGAEEISEKKQNHRDEAPSTQTMQKREKASPLSALKPVTYFNVDDDDSVPFLLETPQQNK